MPNSVQTSPFAFFIAFGAMLSLLWAIGYLFLPSRSKRHNMLLLSFFALSILLFYSFLLQISSFKSWNQVLLLHLPAIYTLGPSLFLFAQYGLSPDLVKKSHHFMLLLPFCITLYVIWQYCYGAPIQGIDLIAYTEGSKPKVYDILLIIGFLINLSYYIYFMVSFRYLFSFRKFSENNYIFYFFAIIMASIVLVVLVLLGAVFRDLRFLHYDAFAITLMICFIFIFQIRYPEFFHILQLSVDIPKTRKSSLNNVNLNELESQLRNLFDNEKIYHDESLTLKDLANEVSLTSHQLSEYINDKLQQNFYGFINSYRINEAKELLLEDKSESILTIAYQVGFGSKSTFNASFIKFTGLTPSIYRKSAGVESKID